MAALADVLHRTRAPLWLYRVTNAGRTRSTNVVAHTGEGARAQAARLFGTAPEDVVVTPVRLFRKEA